MSFYNLFRTPDNRGVGTGNDAFARPSTVPTYSQYGPRYNVQRSFIVTRPGTFKATQLVPYVPIEGNGAAIAGQLALQSLSQEQKGDKR